MLTCADPVPALNTCAAGTLTHWQPGMRELILHASMTRPCVGWQHYTVCGSVVHGA